MIKERTTVDPEKAYKAIADIISMRENIKISVTVKKKEEFLNEKTA